LLKKQRYKFQSIDFLYKIKKHFGYLDGKLAKKIIEEEVDKFLGGKNSD